MKRITVLLAEADLKLDTPAGKVWGCDWEWRSLAVGARLSQPQHVRQLQNPWNFVRSFGNPGCCGWDTRAPFHLGNTLSGCA
jgi:hypothetical protein